jgi:hypothetical protein
MAFNGILRKATSYFHRCAFIRQRGGTVNIVCYWSKYRSGNMSHTHSGGGGGGGGGTNGKAPGFKFKFFSGF